MCKAKLFLAVFLSIFIVVFCSKITVKGKIYCCYGEARSYQPIENAKQMGKMIGEGINAGWNKITKTMDELTKPGDRVAAEKNPTVERISSSTKSPEATKKPGVLNVAKPIARSFVDYGVDTGINRYAYPSSDQNLEKPISKGVQNKGITFFIG